MTDQITITSILEDGAEGSDNDPFNPLARAANKLLTDGDPIRKISHCYFAAEDCPGLFPLRWFGVFVHSRGGRVILFPGFAERYTFVFRAQGTARPYRKPFVTDHLSLEANMRTWHITSLGCEGHEGTFPTIDVGEGRYLWCGISVAGVDRLREVKKQVAVTANVPETDSTRRVKNLVAAREQLIFNTLQLNAKAKQGIAPGFLHFALYVGPCGFPDYRGSLFRIPNSAPYVTPQLPLLTDVPVRSHRVSIPPFDIEVITAWFPGSLSVPVLFTS